MDSGVRWLAHASWHFSVTFVRGLDSEELGRRLGADPAAAPVLATAREIEGLLVDPNVGIARLGEAGGWAFAAEYGEAHGTRHGVLAELSRGGEAVNLDPQTDHPPSMFSCAAGGELLCSFGLAEEGRRWGSNPDLLNTALESAGVFLPDGSVLEAGASRHAQRIAMSLGVIERHFGLSLPRELVEQGELRTVSVNGHPNLDSL
ncbi:DUF6461 domain-containing protein [Actinacidiphila acididurans]|uniref:Uncharacterized protein n=1 Tax=Actinacidiphila acididurans TaxID=2784346 RepID=A0ABS2TXI1_9ACTN|nr:DUF6461 domain-containing protein [Actinacidiphila acididurans]MBM9508044.1 hypothetical protein [Actinacidiphila acididurans]